MRRLNLFHPVLFALMLSTLCSSLSSPSLAQEIILPGDIISGGERNLGVGFDSISERGFRLGTTCFSNPESVQGTRGLRSYISNESKETLSDKLAQSNLNVSFGMRSATIKAKGGVQYLSELASTSKSLKLRSLFDLVLPTRLLSPRSLGLTATNSEKPQDFRFRCGDYYIEEVEYGARIEAVITIDFASPSTKESFAASFDGKYNVAKLSVALSRLSKVEQSQTSISILLSQIGGNPEDLGDALDLPDAPSSLAAAAPTENTKNANSNNAPAAVANASDKRCSVETWESKCKDLLDKAMAYARSAMKSQLKCNPTGPDCHNGYDYSKAQVLRYRLRSYKHLNNVSETKIPEVLKFFESLLDNWTVKLNELNTLQDIQQNRSNCAALESAIDTVSDEVDRLNTLIANAYKDLGNMSQIEAVDLRLKEQRSHFRTDTVPQINAAIDRVKTDCNIEPEPNAIILPYGLYKLSDGYSKISAVIFCMDQRPGLDATVKQAWESNDSTHFSQGRIDADTVYELGNSIGDNFVLYGPYTKSKDNPAKYVPNPRSVKVLKSRGHDVWSACKAKALAEPGAPRVHLYGDYVSPGLICTTGGCNAHYLPMACLVNKKWDDWYRVTHADRQPESSENYRQQPAAIAAACGSPDARFLPPDADD